jgi:hypothetical protein
MRKALRIFVGWWLVKLLILEWVMDLVSELIKAVHNSVKILAVSVQKEYENLKPIDEPVSGENK